MPLEIKKLREEFDSLRFRYKELLEKHNRFRVEFMEHYSWLAHAVHNKYHQSLIPYHECSDPICKSMRRTIEDLRQVEVDLRENNLVSAPEGDQNTEAPRSA